MEYEIDFLPVGEDKKGGDAIVLRYGNLNDPKQQKVIVIDGGTMESGESIVAFIKDYYKTNFVDLVVSTHLHQDHASGLIRVLEELNVGKLAMHLPWDHAENIKSMFVDGKLTTSSLETNLEKSLRTISELEKVAKNKGLKIVEPFTGTILSENIIVLGPSKEYYETLVANFENTPKIKEDFKIAVEGVKTVGEKVIRWIRETLDIESETLQDSDEDTSPENNSSVILLLVIDDKKFLFTGDGGKAALYGAIDYVENLNTGLTDLYFLDVPHHGSRRNIEPSIFEKLNAQIAFISAPKKGDPKHPSRKIVNALIRRKTEVYITKGIAVCQPSQNAPERGWITAVPVSFNDLVED